MQPVLSYSGYKLYKFCPGAYFLSYDDPARRTRAPSTADKTGAVPGLVVDRLFTACLKDGVFDETRFAEDDNLLYAISKSYLTDTNVHLGPSDDKTMKWALTERTAISFFKELRYNLHLQLLEHKLIKPFMMTQFYFGRWNSPCVLSDDLHISGAIDLFSSMSKDEPGVLIDFKASFSLRKLDIDQLKLYWLGLTQKGYKMGLASFLTFRVNHRPVYHKFDDEEMGQFKHRLIQVSNKIKAKEFPFTPSKTACRLCDHRDVCPSAILPDGEVVAAKKRKAAADAVTVLDWEKPEL